MKPSKPYAGFPLFPHDSGKWAKKIKGRLVYFGRWEDPQGALAEYHAWQDRQTTDAASVVTVKDAVNAFLEAKHRKMQAGSLKEASWKDYRDTCKRILDAWGRETPVDMVGPQYFADLQGEWAKKWNVNTVGNEVQRVRVLVKWLRESRICDLEMGPDFKRPSAKEVRLHRQRQAKKLLTPEQVRRLLDHADFQLHAMILLGVNCGFGPHDCAALPLAAVDLERRWIDHPRPKTAVERSCGLWADTVSSLRRAIERRWASGSELLFVMRDGKGWNRPANPIQKRFQVIRGWAGLPDQASFYWLRHTAATVGDGAGDPVAIRYILGHADHSMAGVYREEIDPARIWEVVHHIERWFQAKT